MGFLKRTQFWPYFIFVIWGLADFLVVRYFGLAPWSMIFTFFLLLSLPGFSLYRIFKIRLLEDSLGQIILYISIGLIFAFIVAFFGIMLGSILGPLTLFYILAIIILFVISLVFEFFNPKENKYPNWKLSKPADWGIILTVLAVITIVSVLNTLDQIGANYKGDPYFHLAIMKKVISGQSLSMVNLSYVRDQIHPAYAFPVWHVFMGMLTKLFNTNVFSIWRELVVSLTIFSLVIWYWLTRQIIANRLIALFSFLLFVAILFQWDHGYLFTRLPVPDTFGQLILLPLLVGLAYKTVFHQGDTSRYKLIIILTLLALFTVIIHPTQYFYYLILEVLFFIIYFIFNFRNTERKREIKNFIYLLISNLAVLIPLYFLYQIGSGTVSNTLESFSQTKVTQVRYDKFSSLLAFTKLSYLVVPIVFLISLKKKQHLFILALLAVIPVIYWIQPIKLLSIKILGFIFTNRLYANLKWDFLVLGILFGLIVFAIDRLLSKLLKTKFLRYAIDFFVFGIAIVLTWAQWFESGNYMAVLYQKIFSEDMGNWLSFHRYFVLAGVAILTVIVWFFLRNRKTFETGLERGTTYHNILLVSLILTIFVMLFFASEMRIMYNYWLWSFKNHHFLHLSADESLTVIKPSNLGGQETVDFVSKKIPTKSVFVTNRGYFMLPVVADQHMGAYSSSADIKYNLLWQEGGSLEDKLKLIKQDNVQYILYVGTKIKLEWPEKYPLNFQKVYQNENSQIYKVISSNVF